jgi:penicillin-binding protein 1C
MKLKKGIIWGFVLTSVLFVISVFWPFPQSELDPSPVISLRLEDRNGLLLREVLSDEGGRCRWVRLNEVSRDVLDATIASEDRHFFSHGGVNALSMIRALWQNIRRGEIVSGASTITQQLVRNVHPARRTLLAKLREIWLALRLERTLSKEEILVQYLNRISYGNQAFGIEAASRLYFDKSAAQLSLAEAAFLAAIPRSPTYLNPYRASAAVKKAQEVILRRMLDLNFITQTEWERSCCEDIHLVPEKMKFRAPHFCDFVLSQIPSEERRELSAVRTTLDYALQEKIEVLLENYLSSVENRGISNGALVVIHNATGEILSLVGSKDFFDEARSGQVNGALALRQPGSALKPFTYALALENEMTAASLVDDAPAQFATGTGNYMPQNYDRKYHGLMSLRAALACSYNIPAVALLQAIGPDLLYRRLKSLGFESLNKDPGFYGVGLTLGNGEVTLLELAVAYSALARQGIFLKEQSILRKLSKNGQDGAQPSPPHGEPVFAPEIAYIITDILADRDARVPSFGYRTPLSFPFPVAAKTGTSKDFRDNWTIGYSPKYTVGVWVGNFDGEPMHNVSGITGCGPLFRDVMLLLHQKDGWGGFDEPRGIVRMAVCPLSGERPTPACPGSVEEVFVRGTEPRLSCSRHRNKDTVLAASKDRASRPAPQLLEVFFPRSGDIFKLDPVLRKEHQRIKLRLLPSFGSKVEKVEWWINGEKVGEAGYPYSIFWNLKPGSYTIRATAVMDLRQKAESGPVRIVVLI